MSEMHPCWNPLGPDPPKPLPMERQRDHERKECVSAGVWPSRYDEVIEVDLPRWGYEI
jgi:hypothetical protein